jgi:uncharacterized protein (DUF2237 family)
MNESSSVKNVLGKPLRPCGTAPVTGFFRDGFCHTCRDDTGVHTVCAELTDTFLKFSKAMGNDLSTPRPEYDFDGLKAGDRWCLCANRWLEAYHAGVAPPVVLAATHEATLKIVPLAYLQAHACG